MIPKISASPISLEQDYHFQIVNRQNSVVGKSGGCGGWVGGGDGFVRHLIVVCNP
jgi:hypothetical protein